MASAYLSCAASWDRFHSHPHPTTLTVNTYSTENQATMGFFHHESDEAQAYDQVGSPKTVS